MKKNFEGLKDVVSLIDASKLAKTPVYSIKRMILNGKIKGYVKNSIAMTYYKIPLSEIPKIKNLRSDFSKSNMW